VREKEFLLGTIIKRAYTTRGRKGNEGRGIKDKINYIEAGRIEAKNLD